MFIIYIANRFDQSIFELVFGYPLRARQSSEKRECYFGWLLFNEMKLTIEVLDRQSSVDVSYDLRNCSIDLCSQQFPGEIKLWSDKTQSTDEKKHFRSAYVKELVVIRFPCVEHGMMWSTRFVKFSCFTLRIHLFWWLHKRSRSCIVQSGRE